MKIKEFAEVINGTTPSTKKGEYWGGEIKWITPAELIDGHNWYVYETERMITELAQKERNLKILPEETVLLTSRAPIGKVAIAGSEMCTNQGFKAIICDKSIVNPHYLYYWLLIKKEFLNNLGRGATFKEISKTIVENIEVPIPSLEQQNNIVEIISAILNLIDKRKQQIEELYSLKQSIFNQFINNEGSTKEAKLSDVIEIDIQTMKNFDDYPHYYLVGIDNIERDTGDLINLKTIENENVKGNKHYFNSSHILYSKIRPYLNKVAIPIFEGVCSTDAYPLLVKKDIANKNFIASLLRSRRFVDYTILNSTGANIPRINQKNLLNYKFMLPSLEKQKEFSDQIQVIDEQIVNMKMSLEKFNDLFNALSQKSFNGDFFQDGTTKLIT